MNGIVGAPSNWDVVQENFNLHTDTRSLALLASNANSRLQASSMLRGRLTNLSAALSTCALACCTDQ